MSSNLASSTREPCCLAYIHIYIVEIKTYAFLYNIGGNDSSCRHPAGIKWRGELICCPPDCLVAGFSTFFPEFSQYSKLDYWPCIVLWTPFPSLYIMCFTGRNLKQKDSNQNLLTLSWQPHACRLDNYVSPTALRADFPKDTRVFSQQCTVIKHRERGIIVEPCNLIHLLFVPLRTRAA